MAVQGALSRNIRETCLRCTGVTKSPDRGAVWRSRGAYGAIRAKDNQSATYRPRGIGVLPLS